jgi:hypothetical protein
MVSGFKHLLYLITPIYARALRFELFALLYLHVLYFFLQEALTEHQQGVPVKQEIVYIADINVPSPML